MLQDTIAGIATAMGEGAISIIRVSGDDALPIANKLFRGKDLTTVPSHTINYGFIYDPETNKKVDKIVRTSFSLPTTKPPALMVSCFFRLSAYVRIFMDLSFRFVWN